MTGSGGVKMSKDNSFNDWVASVERGGCGFTYIRFYADAPTWVRNEAINRFGKGTVFLPPRQARELTGRVAA
jgi:hypothetical protein